MGNSLCTNNVRANSSGPVPVPTEDCDRGHVSLEQIVGNRLMRSTMDQEIAANKQMRSTLNDMQHQLEALKDIPEPLKGHADTMADFIVPKRG